MAQQHHWHTKRIPEVREYFGVHEDHGLVEEVCRSLREVHGRNELQKQVARSPLVIFFGQFTDFVVVVLIAAAIVSGLVGDLGDTVIILLIVGIDSIIGFSQELRASRAIDALSALASPQAKVIRGGQSIILRAVDIVPGDVVILEAGGAVPADLRLVEAHQLYVSEAALTGESFPVLKQVKHLDESNIPVGDRSNVAFAGTHVTAGRGLGITVATGMQTELGRIASLLRHEETKTPLQVRLADLGKRISVIALIMCFVIFAWAVVRAQPVLSMFLTALSLAVAAIPEALPAVVTLALARGASRMVRQNALVRRLAVVEALGSVTYICTDKTGTLTQNEMRVVSAWVGTDLEHLSEEVVGSSAGQSLIQSMALNLDVQEQAKGLMGDPMEVAIGLAVAQWGGNRAKVVEELVRVDEVPFESARQMMTTVHRAGDRRFAVTKGAPERVLPLCAGFEQWRDHWLGRAESMAAEGLRVLAFARHPEVPETACHRWEPSAWERDLEFLGLIGLLDPPRPEVVDAVHTCKRAGISVVMITGDHPATARSIAGMVGIGAPDELVVTGEDLERVDDTELQKMVRQSSVYARISPDQKLRIVEALRAGNEYVAMTGDGVNDAPALQAATVGVSMGKIGTDVAREASDLVLLDDNFATIVAAVREGRIIYNNIRKFVRFVLASNVAELLVLLLAPAFGLPLPFLPIHILWINLVTDGLPGLALTVEPEEGDTMDRGPRNPQESIFAQGLGADTIFSGAVLALTALGTALASWASNDPAWRTVVFTELTVSQLLYVLSARGEEIGVFYSRWRTNLPLLLTVLGSVVLQVVILYIPTLSMLLKVEPLGLSQLLFCGCLATIPLWIIELRKLVVYGGKRETRTSP